MKQVNPERLQKILAKAGYGSRRVCETMITDGRVVVNGRPAELGMKADPRIDKIMVDGSLIMQAEDFIYIVIYKPPGVISSTISQDDRRNILDLIQLNSRIYPVGRLDADSEGLVLLTNDGELTYQLTHPKHGVEKEYRVLVGKTPDPQQLNTWRRGVVLRDGYKTKPAEVRLESRTSRGTWLRIKMKEGRKRQFREIGALLGLPVSTIIRTRIGKLLIGSLKAGEWRHLTDREVHALRIP